MILVLIKYKLNILQPIIQRLVVEKHEKEAA